LGRGDVVVPGEVQEAVDGVEGEFGGGVVAELPGAFRGDGGANENFAVGKSDHIRRAGDSEKVAVNFRHRAVAEDRDLDAREGRELGMVFFRDLKAVGEAPKD
jgi:hypothetical protein